MQSDTIFSVLSNAAENKELLLVDGGMCWYKIIDRVLHINVIIATKLGMGSFMIGMMRATEGIDKITLSCPKGLPANDWYLEHGFAKTGENAWNNMYELTLWK